MNAEGSTELSSVTVVIPAFNRENTIQRCLRSVLAQTTSPSEILVIDDGSIDQTAAKADEITDPRIRVIRSTTNLGAQVARNIGIRAASSEWLVFLDSDDEWLPTFLGSYLQRAQESGCDVVYGSGVRKTEYESIVMDISDLENDGYRKVLKKPGPMFGGLMVKRSLLLEIGCLDEAVPAYQEWDTAIRLARVTAFAYQRDPLFVYHIHDGVRISSNLRRDAEGAEYILLKHGEDMFRVAGRVALELRRADVAERFRRAGMVRKWRKHKLGCLLRQRESLLDKYMGLILTVVFPGYSMLAEEKGGAALQARMRLAGIKKRLKQAFQQ